MTKCEHSIYYVDIERLKMALKHSSCGGDMKVNLSANPNMIVSHYQVE